MEKIISPQTFLKYWCLFISAIQYTILTILNKEWHCKTKTKRKRQDTTGTQDVAIINYKKWMCYIDKLKNINDKKITKITQGHPTRI